MKRTELLLLLTISYLVIIAIAYILILKNNAFTSDQNKDRIAQIENSNLEFERLYLLDEIDSLKTKKERLTQELKLTSSVKRELITTEDLLAKKNFKIEEIEYKMGTLKGKFQLFDISLRIALIIIPTLGLFRLFAEFRKTRFHRRISIAPNEIADILTYSFGAIIFIIIFL